VGRKRGEEVVAILEVGERPERSRAASSIAFGKRPRAFRLRPPPPGRAGGRAEPARRRSRARSEHGAEQRVWGWWARAQLRVSAASTRPVRRLTPRKDRGHLPRNDQIQAGKRLGSPTPSAK
jgi:hypothetical protein